MKTLKEIQTYILIESQNFQTSLILKKEIKIKNKVYQMIEIKKETFHMILEKKRPKAEYMAKY